MEKSKKAFLSPTKTSPVIIRVSPQPKSKSDDKDSSSLKLGETNPTESSVQKFKSEKNDRSTITSLINSNLNYCAKIGDLVKFSDTKPHNISKEKETEETINTMTRTFNKTKCVKKDLKDFTESPAIDAKVCPFKATRKRKLGQIRTRDASSSNSPNPAQIKEESSKEKETEETINTMTRTFNKPKCAKKDLKDFTESPAIDAKVCPFKATRKRKLSQIRTRDATSSSSSNSPNPAQIKEESSNSLQSQISNVEITDLEKMREALKQQLQDHIFHSSDEEAERPQTQDQTLSTTLNISEDTFEEKMREVLEQQLQGHLKSSDEEAERPQTQDQTLSTIKISEDTFEEKMREALEQQLQGHLLESSDEEAERPQTQDKSPSTTLKISEDAFEDSNDKKSCADSKSADFQSTLEKSDGALLKEGPPAEPDQPPLVMQSSNLLFNDELDNGHGGGGVETTREEAEPPAKKPKLPEADEEGSAENAMSDADEVDSNLAEKDDSASTSTVDPLNSEQNGVMEFDILDEFESDDNEPNESDSEDSDLSMDEIDAMLEKDYEVKSVNKEPEHEEKEKVILKVRGRDHFDVLPEGWIEVTHNSGMPIYLHKQSRVCSVSKPYFLGPGSTRKHEIPMSAIPCLHYLKEIEKENSAQEDNSNTEPEKPPDPSETSDEVNNPPENEKENAPSISLLLNNKENTNVVNSVIPSARLESVKEQKESGSLDYLAVREYCQKRFEFQTITVKRFKTWSGRRKHQKQLKKQQRPYLPDSTKLITCPLYASSDKTSTLGSNAKKEFIMNPSGKSPVCILHEYVQHTLRLQPKYVFKELESANTPYGAVVIIEDVEYGCGFGSSKKLAKSDAAKSALEILIPKMKMFSPENPNEECQDVEFFDQVRVEDPRVCELSVKAGQPYPYQILLECLKRNYGMGDTEIEFSMNNLKHQKNEFSMKVGKHEVAVVCKNKRDGKHRASQAILQRLHPHIKSWGSLLRMYGKGSCKTLKEKKEEEQRITELQSQACVNKPNMSILNKLKEEMLKYRAKMVAKKPIGKLIPERMEFFSTSNSNLNNVEL